MEISYKDTDHCKFTAKVIISMRERLSIKIQTGKFNKLKITLI